MNFSDNHILKILMDKEYISESQRAEIIRKSSEIRRNLKQVHNVNIGGVTKEIEHPVTMIDIVASMHITYKQTVSGYLDEETIVQAVASQMGFEYKRIDPIKLELELVTKTIPHLFALKHLVVPVQKRDACLEVVMYNPGETEVIKDIKRVVGMEIRPFMGTRQDILKTVREFFGFKISITAAENQFTRPALDLGNLEQYTNLSSLNELHTNEAHIKNAVDYLFRYALDQRASDIHIEPRRDNMLIRMRIDGILHTIYKLPRALHPAMTSRIKTLSRLDIAEKRRPQDGRIKLSHEKTDIEIRVSTIPVAFGEKTVLRLLDPTVIFQDIEQLGFSKRDIKKYQEMIYKPHGIILVTGPTGSGKSTTLYSSLGTIDTHEKNITTIEDPIEMVHDSFNQIAVQPSLGITFSSIIRNILRQDPDIIMVGEMRDSETAANGVQAALTGHLVLSTLHTNDAPSSVARLINLGIKSYLVAESVLGIIAQRLIRTICPHCIQNYPVTQKFLENIGVRIDKRLLSDDNTIILKQGRGCPKCRDTGYLGRIGIFEVMPFDREMRAFIASSQDANTLTLRKMAIKKGMRTLRQDAIKKMLKGITTYQEVARLTEI
ncbi:MAG: General secretion pathway protein E [Candidatus Magnetoglobus multicellularis str. Araruama]|uniref:General secretion pathway protein E n=1 Tax=Candidatus Magnetoglobus multicellularis str. Araruama TaxID=890399 RepID=A0A1V1PFM9_9BACT|nr:MAG: General secretion pathway protein E [Candidatus Magnetoglobus multicellularis str. Araruama]